MRNLAQAGEQHYALWAEQERKDHTRQRAGNRAPYQAAISLARKSGSDARCRGSDRTGDLDYHGMLKAHFAPQVGEGDRAHGHQQEVYAQQADDLAHRLALVKFPYRSSGKIKNQGDTPAK